MIFITNAPMYIWPLFILLVFVGIRSIKANRAPLFLLLIFPILLFIASLNFFLDAYGHSSLFLIYWICCIGVGSSISFAYIGKLQLQFDEKKRWVELPGSLIPLVLCILIFSLKCSIGVIKAEFPHLTRSIPVLICELISALILGLFLGRGIACFVRSRKLPNK